MKNKFILIFLTISILSFEASLGKEILQTGSKSNFKNTANSFLVNHDSITVISYNIRYDSPNDGKNKWEFRKNGLAKMLKNLNPEIIGIQEGLKHQIDFLQKKLQNFDVVGIDRDNNFKGEYSSIFFNKLTFKLISTETFWLSQSPKTTSKGWDASYPRICTYVILEHKISQEKIYVFNTHLDHIGATSRIEGSKLIIQKIKEITPKNAKTILMGDFNDNENSETISYIKSYLVDGKNKSLKNINTQKGTYNGFNVNSDLKYRLDYIFSKNLRFKTYVHVKKTLQNTLWPSDHLPVLASFEM